MGRLCSTLKPRGSKRPPYRAARLSRQLDLALSASWYRSATPLAGDKQNFLAGYSRRPAITRDRVGQKLSDPPARTPGSDRPRPCARPTLPLTEHLVFTQSLSSPCSRRSPDDLWGRKGRESVKVPIYLFVGSELLPPRVYPISTPHLERAIMCRRQAWKDVLFDTNLKHDV